jgi:hypothetical protein
MEEEEEEATVAEVSKIPAAMEGVEEVVTVLAVFPLINSILPLFDQAVGLAVTMVMMAAGEVSTGWCRLQVLVRRQGNLPVSQPSLQASLLHGQQAYLRTSHRASLQVSQRVNPLQVYL